MIYDYDFINQIIDIPYGISSVVLQDLIDDIRSVEATVEGIGYGSIATATGKESLGNNVQVGITVNLLDSWQIRFASGSYIARVTGGNLVGGYQGDPIAYSAGVQVLLVQSAASTVVNVGGSSLTSEEHAQLMRSSTLSTDEHNTLMQTLTVPLYLGLK